MVWYNKNFLSISKVQSKKNPEWFAGPGGRASLTDHSGERLVRIREVKGLSPFRSTNKNTATFVAVFLLGFGPLCRAETQLIHLTVPGWDHSRRQAPTKPLEKTEMFILLIMTPVAGVDAWINSPLPM